MKNIAWRKVIWLCWGTWNHTQWPFDPGLAVSTKPLNLSVTAAGKTLWSRKPTRTSVPSPSLTRKFSYLPFCRSPCFDLVPLSVVISLFYTQSHAPSLSFFLSFFLSLTFFYPSQLNQLLYIKYENYWASLVAQWWRIHLQMQERQVQSVGQKDPLEKEMEAHSSILAWKIPWREEPCGLQSMGSQKQSDMT